MKRGQEKGAGMSDATHTITIRVKPWARIVVKAAALIWFVPYLPMWMTNLVKRYGMQVVQSDLRKPAPHKPSS